MMRTCSPSANASRGAKSPKTSSKCGWTLPLREGAISGGWTRLRPWKPSWPDGLGRRAAERTRPDEGEKRYEQRADVPRRGTNTRRWRRSNRKALRLRPPPDSAQIDNPPGQAHGHKEFRELVEELAMLMAFEVTRSHPTREIEVETPLARTKGRSIAGREIAVIPILRAGLAMEVGITRLIPTARVGHVGIYRDPESLEPVTYYSKLPVDIAEREAMIVDPMLATGDPSSPASTLSSSGDARRSK